MCLLFKSKEFSKEKQNVMAKITAMTTTNCYHNGQGKALKHCMKRAVLDYQGAICFSEIYKCLTPHTCFYLKTHQNAQANTILIENV